MIRRLILLLIIVLAIAGTFFYQRWHSARSADIRERSARATAQIWVATADFRNNPEQFLTFRDSVLRDHGLTADEVEQYASQDAAEPERYSAFVSRVNDLVDSLVAVRIRRAGAESADSTDSATISGTTTATDTADIEF